MAEHPVVPLSASRLVTTAEMARFATCRLAWWYDRTHPLARAAPSEVTRRLELFEAVYGPGVRDLPEYHLLTHLRDQAQVTPQPAAQPQSARSIAPTEQPQRLVGCVIVAALALIALLVLGVMLAVMRL